MPEQQTKTGPTLTNAQAALMAAVEVEKNIGETYRYRGQRERVIAGRAAEFLAFLDTSSPPTPGVRDG